MATQVERVCGVTGCPRLLWLLIYHMKSKRISSQSVETGKSNGIDDDPREKKNSRETSKNDGNRKRLKAKWTCITPTRRCGQRRTHAHKHITRPGIRQPWIGSRKRCRRNYVRPRKRRCGNLLGSRKGFLISFKANGFKGRRFTSAEVGGVGFKVIEQRLKNVNELDPALHRGLGSIPVPFAWWGGEK